jgi:diguanylate cyclase (GGDEF)-like protein
MTIREVLIYLLSPGRPLGWPLRLGFWCSLIAATTLLVEWAFGLLEPAHILEHAGLILAVTAPLILAVLWLTQHLVQMQTKLIVLARHDPLTGIANRRAFFDAMESVGEGTILMIDVDHFKRINDTFGHAAGDRVLVRIARHLRTCTRSGDLIGRLGGEEFAVFLADADEDRARAVGERIAKGLTVADGDSQQIHVTLSVGAAHSRHANDAPSLANLADKALFAAKDAGRSRLMIWPHDTTSQAA